jgi:peptidoglycan biosynthesis protein MviN/MurJ (putative lipid II flippase)
VSTSTVTNDRLERRRLTSPVAALLATELFHIAATLANDGQPTAHHAHLGPPAHVLAAVLTAGLLIWIRQERSHARTLTAIAGFAVVAAAMIYHVLPIESDYLNPFKEGATAAQWISVVLGVLAGVWCTAVALRAPQRANSRQSGPID